MIILDPLCTLIQQIRLLNYTDTCRYSPQVLMFWQGYVLHSSICDRINVSTHINFTIQMSHFQFLVWNQHTTKGTFKTKRNRERAITFILYFKLHFLKPRYLICEKEKDQPRWHQHQHVAKDKKKCFVLANNVHIEYQTYYWYPRSKQ